jgi:hypothetical protein
LSGCAKTQNVVALSRFFDAHVATALIGSSGEDDRLFKQHLGYVFNQILQTVARDGATQEALEKSGKLLLRLYSVFQMYKKKKELCTAPEWIDKLAKVLTEMSDGV